MILFLAVMHCDQKHLFFSKIIGLDPSVTSQSIPYTPAAGGNMCCYCLNSPWSRFSPYLKPTNTITKVLHVVLRFSPYWTPFQNTISFILAITGLLPFFIFLVKRCLQVRRDWSINIYHDFVLILVARWTHHKLALSSSQNHHCRI